MKKKILITLAILLTTVTVFATTKNFTISSSNLSFENSKKQAIKQEFNKDYVLEYKISSSEEAFEEEIISLTKKVTYLLLGEMGEGEETAEEYYNRHQEYLGMRYAPDIPLDDTTLSGYDEYSQEYSDDIVSGTSVPGMFLIFDELKITYNSYGNIRVVKTDNGVISSIALPNVKMKVESEENPKEYTEEKTNLVIYYYYKQLNNEYKLYYVMGETVDSLEDTLSSEESNESGNGVSVNDADASDLRNIYDFSKIDNLSQDSINNISNNNKSNLMILNSYYNNYLIGTANGVVIKEGIVVTTWSFIEDALINAQYITLKDGNGTSYELDGIITVNLDSDLAVLKLKKETVSKVTVADSTKVLQADAAIIMSSKTGVGINLKKGIAIANDGYIQTSIPVTKEEQGSPLFNSNGEVIGLTSANSVNTSISLSIPSAALQEIQTKFNELDFSKIKSITFDKLKEDYYYISYKEELVENNISDSKWKEYSKIGNIEKTITLDLVKANYKNKVVSLRYKNNITSYISSMQLATGFIDALEEQGYQEVSSSTTKKIYSNNKYQVTIMEEFDYLIIVMVKL